MAPSEIDTSLALVNSCVNLDVPFGLDMPRCSLSDRLLFNAVTCVHFHRSFAYKGDEETSNEQDNIDVAQKAKAAAKGCPPLLCKIRPASDAACNSYQNGTGTIGKGSVTVGRLPFP